MRHLIIDIMTDAASRPCTHFILVFRLIILSLPPSLSLLPSLPPSLPLRLSPLSLSFIHFFASILLLCSCNCNNFGQPQGKEMVVIIRKAPFRPFCWPPPCKLGSGDGALGTRPNSRGGAGLGLMESNPTSGGAAPDYRHHGRRKRRDPA